MTVKIRLLAGIENPKTKRILRYLAKHIKKQVGRLHRQFKSHVSAKGQKMQKIIEYLAKEKGKD